MLQPIILTRELGNENSPRFRRRPNSQFGASRQCQTGGTAKALAEKPEPWISARASQRQPRRRKPRTGAGANGPPALADTFEAVVGAIFVDGGFAAAEQFVKNHFHEAYDEAPAIPILENPKGELQEFLQARSAEAPVYNVVSASGPDHDRVFECTVQHEGKELARGRGKSKKEAESGAALAALNQLRETQK